LKNGQLNEMSAKVSENNVNKKYVLRVMLIEQSYRIGKSDISLVVFSPGSVKTNVG